MPTQSQSAQYHCQRIEARLKVLREIFFPEQDNELLYSDDAPTRNGLSGETLNSRSYDALEPQAIPERRICARPRDSSAIFVSIDFEFDHSHHTKDRPPIREIGISTLDSRVIQQQTPEERRSIIFTENFVWKLKSSIKKTSSTQLSKMDQFLFGNSKTIHHEKDIPAIIEEAIRQRDTDGRPRWVILVGQGIIHEVRSMRDIGIDIRDQAQFPWILDICSTDIFAKSRNYRSPADMRDQATGKRSHVFTMERQLERFGIPFMRKHIHNGGNDSNFALKIFLAITVQSLRHTCLNSAQRATLDAIQSIAQAPIDMEMREASLKRRQVKLEGWKPSLRPPLQLDLKYLPNVLSGEAACTLLQDALGFHGNHDIGDCGLKPPVSDDATVLFLALHLGFEGGRSQLHGRDDNQIRTVGFSVFNTKCLEDLLRHPGEAIVTENFKRHEDSRMDLLDYLFGESKIFFQGSYVEAFRSRISHHKSQRLILLGYDINHALCALRNSGFDFPQEFPPSISIIDVKSMAMASTKGIFDKLAEDNGKETILRKLLPKSAVPRNLQIAGNVTHTVLKSALILAVREFQNNNTGKILCPLGVKRASALESIGLAPIEEKSRKLTLDRLAFSPESEEEALARKQAIEAKKKQKEELRAFSWDDIFEDGINAAWNLE